MAARPGALGRGRRHFLAPGGTFYIFETHPTACIFDTAVTTPVLQPRYSYFEHKEPLHFEYHSPLAVPDTSETSIEYDWGHGLGEIVTSLVDAGCESSSCTNGHSARGGCSRSWR